MSKGDLMRKHAEKCLQLAELADDKSTQNHLRNIKKTWIALADAQDWLDGAWPKSSPTVH